MHTHTSYTSTYQMGSHRGPLVSAQTTLQGVVMTLCCAVMFRYVTTFMSFVIKHVHRSICSAKETFNWSFVRKTLLGPRPKPHLKLACNPADYTCKLADYTCKLAVYTCKVLNFRFTSVTLITLLDTVRGNTFFSQFFLPYLESCM